MAHVIRKEYCFGCGACAFACPFDVPVYDLETNTYSIPKEKCVDCKACMKACPKGLIIEVPYKAKAHIGCVNPEKGKPVMSNCQVGCISCQKCVKGCPFEAITMEGGFPVIDYEKCKNCGKCVRECPRKCIV